MNRRGLLTGVAASAVAYALAANPVEARFQFPRAGGAGSGGGGNVLSVATMATTGASGHWLQFSLAWTGAAPTSVAATWNGGGGTATIQGFSQTGPLVQFWASTPLSGGTYNIAFVGNNGGTALASGIVISAPVTDFAPGIYGDTTPMYGRTQGVDNDLFAFLPFSTYFARGLVGPQTAFINGADAGPSNAPNFTLAPQNGGMPGQTGNAFNLCCTFNTNGGSPPSTFHININITDGITLLTLPVVVQNPNTPSVMVGVAPTFNGPSLAYGGNLILDTAVDLNSSGQINVVTIAASTAITFTPDTGGLFSVNSGEGTLQIAKANLTAANYGMHTVQLQASGGPLQTVPLYIGHGRPPDVAWVPNGTLYSSTPGTDNNGSNLVGTLASYSDSHGGIINSTNPLNTILSDSSGQLQLWNTGAVYLTAPINAGTLTASFNCQMARDGATTMLLNLPVLTGISLSASNMAGAPISGLTNFLPTANALTPSGSPTTVLTGTVSGFANAVQWSSTYLQLIGDNAQLPTGGNPLVGALSITPRYAISGSGTSFTVTATNLSATDETTPQVDQLQITVTDGLGTFCTQTFNISTAWHAGTPGTYTVGPASALWPSPTWTSPAAMQAAMWASPGTYTKVRVLRGCPAGALYTASISNGSGGSGTILNVTAIASGRLAVGMSVLDALLAGAGVAGGTRITAFVSGTLGGVGVYTVNASQFIASTQIAAGDWNYGPGGGGSGFSGGWWPNPILLTGDDSTQASFVGTISNGSGSAGNILNIPGAVTGQVFVSDWIVTGASTGTLIMTQIDATHWTVNNSQLVTAVAMTTQMTRPVLNFYGPTAPGGSQQGGLMAAGGYDFIARRLEISFTSNGQNPNEGSSGAVYKVGTHTGNVTLDSSYLHDSDNGYINAAPGNIIRILNCLIGRCGNDGGVQHNIYVGEAANFIMTGSNSFDSLSHEVKSRAQRYTITGNKILNGINCTSLSCPVDLTQGGNGVFSNNIVLKFCNNLISRNSILLQYDAEMQQASDATLGWCWYPNTMIADSNVMVSLIPLVSPFQNPHGFASGSYTVLGSSQQGNDIIRNLPILGTITNTQFFNLPSPSPNWVDGFKPPVVGAGNSNTATYPLSSININDPLTGSALPFTPPRPGATPANFGSAPGTYGMTLSVPSGSGSGTPVSGGLLAGYDWVPAPLTSPTYSFTNITTPNDNAKFSLTPIGSNVQISTVGSLANGMYLIEIQAVGTGFVPGTGNTTITEANAFQVIVQ